MLKNENIPVNSEFWARKLAKWPLSCPWAVPEPLTLSATLVEFIGLGQPEQAGFKNISWQRIDDLASRSFDCWKTIGQFRLWPETSVQTFSVSHLLRNKFRIFQRRLESCSILLSRSGTFFASVSRSWTRLRLEAKSFRVAWSSTNKLCLKKSIDWSG